MQKSKIGRSPAPKVIPLARSGRPPLYRVKVPSNFKDILVGATLGNRYWVLSVIGKGGMSVVYRAKTKDTGKVVAVKTLRTQGLTDEMLVKRFQREAELLSRLNHPRIVNLHAYGTSARGQPYFVMDFLRGENLTDVLKAEDHLAPERFQDIFVQVCAAIEHAHKHNAIHRDIKPGNIMLTRQGRTVDYVKIVDFGIAMISEEAQRLTRMGEVWGSPIYMSPEQCMGATVDLRSDIYSLGIVMFESLTGRVPFLGRNYADTMGKQISEAPPNLSEVRPDLTIPANFEKIIHKAMAKQPDDRYQTLTQMRKDLEAALSYTTDKAPRISDSHANLKARKKTVETPQHREITPKEEPRPVSKKETSRTNLKAVSVKDKGAQKRSKKTAAKDPPKSRMLPVVGFSLLLSLLIIVGLSQKDFLAKALSEVARALLRGETEYTSPYQYPVEETNQNSSTGQTTGLEDLKEPPVQTDTIDDNDQPAMETATEESSDTSPSSGDSQ